MAIAENYHQVGRLQEAEQIYRQILAIAPQHADAWQSLGAVAFDAGDFEQAAICFQRALQIQPNWTAAEVNLGVAWTRLGKFDDAISCFRRALTIEPALAEAHYNLGQTLHEQGNLEQAVPCYLRAVELRPNYLKAAINLGIVLRRLGKLDDSVACYRHVLQIAPGNAEVYSNLGATLHDQGNFDEAAACCQRALELKPNLEQAYCNLGASLRSLGRLEEALTCCRSALQLKPDSVEAQVNLANALQDLGQLDEALMFYGQALDIEPNHAEAHTNRAMVWLLKGDYEHGWPEFEWRWKKPLAPPTRFGQPRWDGSPLAGRSILLFAEQGLGDTLHYIRYAPMVKQQGGRVLVECQPALMPLLTDLPGVDLLLPQGAPLPDFDLQSPLVSLPGIFRTTLANIPANVPYLFAKPQLIEQWSAELQQTTEFKIGIVWQGSRGYKADRFRSLPLSEFAPLAELQGVRLFSLQKGDGSEQVTAFAERYRIVDLGQRLDIAAGPFMDTAAVIQNLDLIIAPDTAIAQLAAAMGKPVWLLLSYAPDWRWMLNRDDSPWYPTMRLFRQRRLGEWGNVIERVRNELLTLIRAGK